MSDFQVPFEKAPPVPLPRIVNFVRQITHDVRNGLNAIDLQSAYISEIAGVGEVAEELGKLRKMVGNVTRDMSRLSSRFGELRPALVEYPVEDFLHSLKRAVEQEFEGNAKRIVWESRAGDTEMEMDYNLQTCAILELIQNAIYFREGDQAIHFAAWPAGAKMIFEVRQLRNEPVTGAEAWGREPLMSTRRGGYGLGLFYVRRILDTLGGTLEPGYDAASGELRVRLTLPLKQAGQPGSKQ